jgi:hypothetical protein
MNMNFKYGEHMNINFKYGGNFAQIALRLKCLYCLRKFQNCFSKMTVKIAILYFFWNFVSIKIYFMKVHFAIIED